MGEMGDVTGGRNLQNSIDGWVKNEEGKRGGRGGERKETLDLKDYNLLYKAGN